MIDDRRERMTIKQEEKVFLHIHDRVAHIILNRPQVLNAMDVEMLQELVTTLKDVSTNSDVDIVVLGGNGRGFSAGGDIKTMLSSTDDSAFFPVMDTISEVITTLYTMPKLVISAIHGPVAGLGLSFALAADYIIAEKQSQLAMNFIGIGLIPDGGGHFFLQQRVGEQKAKQIIWDGRKITGDAALELGLVDEVVEEDLQKAVLLKVREWLHKPISAMIETKMILSQSNLPTLLKILELEKLGQHKMRATADHQEGIRAFLEKRRPNYTGK